MVSIQSQLECLKSSNITNDTEITHAAIANIPGENNMKAKAEGPHLAVAAACPAPWLHSSQPRAPQWEFPSQRCYYGPHRTIWGRSYLHKCSTVWTASFPNAGLSHWCGPWLTLQIALDASQLSLREGWLEYGRSEARNCSQALQHSPATELGNHSRKKDSPARHRPFI